MTDVRIEVGDQLPTMSFIGHDGRSWNPRAFHGRPVVLVLHRHLA